jgi:enoyl-CoA hydratase
MVFIAGAFSTTSPAASARSQRQGSVRSLSSAGERGLHQEAQAMAYETILVETRGPIGVITLNRPKAMNALNGQLIGEINQATRALDGDPQVAVVVITGSERAFAAGADIKEMREKTFISAFQDDFIAPWQEMATRRKPLIAAVAGYALGGGCELAMMCDIIIAADTAKFGQPEINLGTIPGAGGTQRLIRAVGKAKAMEMILTGRMMDAEEAERANLVARVVPAADLLDEAMKLATTIAEKSQPVVAMAKEAVNAAYETTLNHGLLFERSLFYATFATEDRKEGMQAFAEKRTPNFSNQ